MSPGDLETVHEAMARAIDEVGPERAGLYLAKLALALAETLGSAERALAIIEECREGL